MQLQTKHICDGVDLRILNDTKFKTNTISLFFNIPLKRETVTRAALLPAILKRGSQKYPTLTDVSRRLADMYSASCYAGVRMKGDGEVLYFTVEYIADSYIGQSLTADAAEFLREFVFCPLLEDGCFTREYTQSEKTNLKNAISGLINDKKEYADVKCREAMFGRDGYGMFEAGYEEDLESITPQSMYEFYSDIIKNAKVDIFLGGTVTEEVKSIAERVLVPELKPRSGGYVKTVPATVARTEAQYITEEIDVVQSKLSIGLRCGVDACSDDYYALMLGTCIFGGSPFSKLFNNVREKLSLAYYAASRTDRLKSVMMISSGIETKNYNAAHDEIMVQLEKMRNGEISDDELAAAKKYLANGINSMKDSMRTMEDYYLSQIIMGTQQSPEELLECINRVEISQIRDVMRGLSLDTVYLLKGNADGEEE